MPELPDVAAYVHALDARIVGARLERVRLASMFVLRTADPPLRAVEGRIVDEIRRIGKRIAIGCGDIWVVIHLMIAGRLHWRAPNARIGSRNDLAAFDFAAGTLTLTEAGTKRRASIHLVRGEAALAAHDPGGIEVMTASLETFRTALRAENRTLKRALTDPRIVDGIGNAYSDEILHAAKLSPLALTHKLDDSEWQRLHEAASQTLAAWIARLDGEARAGFPERVTAFREEMAVHGKFGKPCPQCGTAVQRIRYADNETNYCPRCQTGGVVLADRSLSRLLKGDWPRTLDELDSLERTSH